MVGSLSLASALALACALLTAAIVLPLVTGRMAREPGVRATQLAGELRTVVTEGLQGAEELFLLQTLGDDRAVAEVYVAGKPAKSALLPA